MSKWVQVKDLTPYIESNDWSNEGPGGSLYRGPLAQRVYAPEGQQYPLLSIAIYANQFYKSEPVNGIKIGVSYKEKSGRWWNDGRAEAYIPFELLGELQEMIREAVAQCHP